MTESRIQHHSSSVQPSIRTKLQVRLLLQLDVTSTHLTSFTPDAFFTIASTGNFGNGTSTNTFSYIDLAGNTYDREISSINTNITSDHQGGTLAPKQVAHFPSFSPQEPLSVSKARLPGGRVVGN